MTDITGLGLDELFGQAINLEVSVSVIPWHYIYVAIFILIIKDSTGHTTNNNY